MGPEARTGPLASAPSGTVSTLSCYTAAVHGYLCPEWDADAVMARSIRPAVRGPLPGTGLLAFSHHDPPLHFLPDGTRLRYASAGSLDDLHSGVATELARHGRVIVMADSSRLPWSVDRDGGPRPHWFVVTAAARKRWQVSDPFAAHLPGHGDQAPFTGWVEDTELHPALTLTGPWSPAQRLRNDLALGRSVPMPQAPHVWLARTTARGKDGPGSGHGDEPRAGPGDGWALGRPGVLRAVAELFRPANPDPFAQIDDLWAMAGHHVFACRWWLAWASIDGAGSKQAAEELRQWVALPRLLRVALESQERGRPRHGLVRTALLSLAELPSA